MSLAKELFDIENTHIIKISFQNSNYDSILKKRWEKNAKEYELTDIEFIIRSKKDITLTSEDRSTGWTKISKENDKYCYQNKTLKNVGVRYKGNSTYKIALDSNNPKLPFNIDFNLNDDYDYEKILGEVEYKRVDDQTLLGYKKIKLSNSIFDTTYTKDHLGYLLMKEYIPTCNTSNVEVFVNIKNSNKTDTKLGLYILTEAINKAFWK